MTETKTGWAKFWAGLKFWTYKYIGGLCMEEKDGERVISIGRCMLLATLAWLFWFWSSWHGYGSVTPEQLAQIVLENLPADTRLNEYHVQFAAKEIIEALPRGTPPLLDTVFLTACGYVFGSKVAGVVSRRLNRR
jgi:hypothetical protein